MWPPSIPRCEGVCEEFQRFQFHIFLHISLKIIHPPLSNENVQRREITELSNQKTKFKWPYTILNQFITNRKKKFRNIFFSFRHFSQFCLLQIEEESPQILFSPKMQQNEEESVRRYQIVQWECDCHYSLPVMWLATKEEISSIFFKLFCTLHTPYIPVNGPMSIFRLKKKVENEESTK